MTTIESVREALRAVADPCCKERGISVVDMGLLHDVRVTDATVEVDVLLTSGWCPFQVDLVEQITGAVESLPDVDRAAVRIVLDAVWSTERMDPGARAKLRFLPEPAEAGDPADYVARARLPVIVTRPARPVERSTT